MSMLGGWWRLWLVVSVVFGFFAWLAASNAHDVSNYSYGMTKDQTQTWGQAAVKATRVCDIKGHDVVTATPDENGLYDGHYSCTSDRQFILSFILALLPGAVLAVLGLTLRWVWRGFRMSKA